MPRKNKVSVTTEPTKYRLSSSERRAAQLAEISGKQGDLKREAAERRAKRAGSAGEQTGTAAYSSQTSTAPSAKTDAAALSTPGPGAAERQSDSR